MAVLIAIEGIDGSGKGTQSARLVETLQQQNQSVELLSFPRYEHTKFGAAIGEFLNGKFGQLDEVHPQLASLLFAGDRFESKDVILDAAERHDVVVFDRYVASNVAHQAAKLDEPERSQLMQWIDRVEFDIYGLPRPDLTILLDLPATMAQRLIAEKAARTYTDKAADLQEADGDYLERVRQVYRTMAENNDGWRIIDCLSGGKVRAIEDIADELHSVADQTLVASRP